MDKRAVTVSAVNQYMKTLFDHDYLLSNMHITGELSNLKIHSSGHLYFTLKDDFATLSCVMFKSKAQNITFPLENGMQVNILGYISMYEKTGAVQLYAEFITLAGKGVLYAAFEQMKNRLMSEGLFDEAYKKRIPPYPTRIAVITSPTGAVLHDILHVATRRNPLVSFTVVPVSVQGQTAAFEIAGACKLVNQCKRFDLIILARGGGSIEDLWAFNEEVVARAVFSSKVPVISAVGHETDFTIADFVADLRAPTPSAAAEMATPLLSDMVARLDGFCYAMAQLLGEKMSAEELRLQYLLKRLQATCPARQLENKEKDLDRLRKALCDTIARSLQQKEHRLDSVLLRLHALSPLLVLTRGYSITKKADGVLVNTVEDVVAGQRVVTQLRDGKLVSVVERVERESGLA